MFLTDVLNCLVEQKDLFLQLTLQHLELSFTAIIIAIIIGLILGIIASEYPKNKWILSVVNFVYTIPSIALFGFLIPLVGIGDINGVTALIIYGLLPMVRGTYTGITNINKDIIEAAKGMGSTNKQILRKIKLPLATPHIMNAIRTMVVMTIALAGIASFIGAGGLGVAIYRGITTNNITLTVAGSLLIAIVALVIDWILGEVEKLVQIGRPKSPRIEKIKNVFFNKKILTLLIIIIVGVSAAGVVLEENNANNTIHIAGKPMTEQYVLVYILQGVIENSTDLNVEVTPGVAGGVSYIVPGLESGEFDMCPEYTGTAWNQVLKEKSIYNPSLFNQLQKKYEEKYNLTWVGMYGFNDEYGIGVNKEFAEEHNLKTYSDLAKISSQVDFGAEPDFYQRDDGYPGLCKDYGFNFKSTTDIDIGLKYDALEQNKVDAIIVYTTDGRLENPNITVLTDDKHYFPSYEAGSVIREDELQKHPEMRSALMKLNNKISMKDMIHMNYEVDVEKKDPKVVANEFLKQKGLA